MSDHDTAFTEQGSPEERAAIRAMLAGAPAPTLPQGGVPLDLDPEIAARLARRDALQRQIAENEIPAEEEPDPERGKESRVFEGRADRESMRRALFSPSNAQLMPDIPQEHLEPTDADKAHYLKSVLHDIPVQLDVELPGMGVTARLRSLSNFEQEVIFRRLRDDAKGGAFEGPTAYVTSMQQYSMAMQLLRWGDKGFDPVGFEAGKHTLDGAAAALEEAVKRVKDTGWAAWNAQMTALYIFENKLTACNRAAIDRNFWLPAGSA